MSPPRKKKLRMQNTASDAFSNGSSWDPRTVNHFVTLLKACARSKDLSEGARLHADILKQGFLAEDPNIASSLLIMYAKCGTLLKAQELHDALPVRSVITWSVLIAGYSQQGQGEIALSVCELMRHEGLSPDAVTFTGILKACGSIGAADKGKQIHDEIDSLRLLEKNLALGNALVDMYAKCGMFTKAQQVLEKLSIRDVVSWNGLIAGYSQGGKAKEALNCFEQMRAQNVHPDSVTFMCILKTCGSLQAVDMGKQVHGIIIQQKLLGKHILLDNALVDMYAKCGVLIKAAQVFDELPIRDVVSWNSLISGYVQCKKGEKALCSFEQLHIEGLFPDIVTFICILKACSLVQAADKGRQIHDEIASQGLLENDIALGSALVDMYSKCGSLAKAHEVVDELPVHSLVSWSALITGYARLGHGREALNCFEQMRQEGFFPDMVTFVCILKACGCIGATEKGKIYYDEIASQGLLDSNDVLGSALVDMFAKCGALGTAEQVLDSLHMRDTVTWNALLTAYAEQEQGEEVLNCSARMQRDGHPPDSVSFICTLKACGSLGAADQGKRIHGEIVTQGMLEGNVSLGSALMDMYVKCGALEEAQQVFDELAVHNVVTWNILIVGYSQELQSAKVLSCFEWLQCEGLSPDVVTFICMLNACGRSGLVDIGQVFLANMKKEYDITPGLEHFSCMVDMFGRAGLFDMALAVIKKMQFAEYSPTWSALLAACQNWGNVKLGKWIFEYRMSELVGVLGIMKVLKLYVLQT